MFRSTSLRLAAIYTTAFALAVVALAVPAAAQGVISGAVVDRDGGPVVGAHIYLTNVGMQSQLEFQTLVNGRFEFSGLRPGEYRLTSMTQSV